MEVHQVLESVQNNSVKEGWAVFPYGLAWALRGILFNLSYSLVFIGLALSVSAQAFTEGIAFVPMEKRFVSLLFIIAGIYFVYRLIRHLLDLKFYRSNMLVLTDDALVWSYGRLAQQFKYQEIAELEIHNQSGTYRSVPMFPRSYIQFKNISSGEYIRIGESAYLPHIQEIHSILNSKLA